VEVFDAAPELPLSAAAMTDMPRNTGELWQHRGRFLHQQRAPSDSLGSNNRGRRVPRSSQTQAFPRGILS